MAQLKPDIINCNSISTVRSDVSTQTSTLQEHLQALVDKQKHEQEQEQEQEETSKQGQRDPGLDQDQQKSPASDKEAQLQHPMVPYVGVDWVPGHSRWPYRAVLSLPAWILGDSSHEVVRCEGYYSTAEAAARAVDTICMVLLGEQAAINFPHSSYNRADLQEAADFLNSISGGAFSGCYCSSFALKQAAALMLLPSMRNGQPSRTETTRTS